MWIRLIERTWNEETEVMEISRIIEEKLIVRSDGNFGGDVGKYLRNAAKTCDFSSEKTFEIRQAPRMKLIPPDYGDNAPEIPLL